METPEPHKSQIPFSPTKKHTAQYMRQEGKPLADIAAELDVSISSVSHNLQNLGRSQNFCASTDELEKIWQGIELGDYPDASAAHCALVPHIDVTTVRRALSDMGLYGRHRRAVPVLTEWYHISDEEITHLYDSIPRRIAAVIKGDGWYTEY